MSFQSNSSTAINLNGCLQQNFICSIHQGLLERPIVLPTPCLHQFCTKCFEEYLETFGGQPIVCPQCKTLHTVPSTWITSWFNPSLNHDIKTLASNQSETNKKIIDFVQHSYTQFGNTSVKLKITSINQLYNSKLKENFEKCKKQLDCIEVITLLHGTNRKAAYAISSQGFSIPTIFEQNEAEEEELKFGQAIYFAHAKKASDYGKNIFILTDCIIGRTKLTNESEKKLTPEIIHHQGYDTICYSNTNKNLTDQEWAIYRSDQCFPLAIIDYELLDQYGNNEQIVINEMLKMNLKHPNYNLLRNALNGTDNQCQAMLKLITNAISKNLPGADILIYEFLWKMTQKEKIKLFKHDNETIQILFLKLLWQISRCINGGSTFIRFCIDFPLLIEILNSNYAEVSWRVCGILTNMAAQIIDIRHTLTEPQVLNQLLFILQRTVRSQNKTGTITVLNLVTNIISTKYNIIEQKFDILNYLNKHILNHSDKEIQTAGNQLLSNINGEGIIITDFQKHTKKDTKTTTQTQLSHDNSTQNLCDIFLSIFSKILH